MMFPSIRAARFHEVFKVILYIVGLVPLFIPSLHAVCQVDNRNKYVDAG